MLEPCHIQSDGGPLSTLFGLAPPPAPLPDFQIPIPLPIFPLSHNFGDLSVSSDRQQLFNPYLNLVLLVVMSLHPLSNVAHDEGSHGGLAADGVPHL